MLIHGFGQPPVSSHRAVAVASGGSGTVASPDLRSRHCSRGPAPTGTQACDPQLPLCCGEQCPALSRQRDPGSLGEAGRRLLSADVPAHGEAFLSSRRETVAGRCRDSNLPALLSQCERVSWTVSSLVWINLGLVFILLQTV